MKIDKTEEIQNTGILNERELDLVEIGRSPLSSTLAASGTLSGSLSYLLAHNCIGSTGGDQAIDSAVIGHFSQAFLRLL